MDDEILQSAGVHPVPQREDSFEKIGKKTLEYSDLPGWKSISITFHEKMMGGVGGRGLGLGGGEKRLG